MGASGGTARALSRHVGTVSGLTLLSRIAGLARDMVIAFMLGTGMSADAFYVAFRIPNLMRRLLAEGAFTMAFVPTYADYRRESPAAAAQAANTIFSILLCVLIVLVSLGILFAPWLVKMVAFGFAEDPEKFTLTVSLARLMFPYLLCVSTMALMMGVLNSHKHFIAPAAAPIAFNLCLIVGAAYLSRFFAEPSYGLAIGVVCGGFAQLLVQLPPLIKRHLLPRFTTLWRHPSVRQLLRIMIPATYGGAVYQINVMLVTLFASFLPSGSVSYLWYADRITEFPLGIFAVAIATVTLPTLSEQRSADDMRAFSNTVQYGLRMALAITTPAAIGLLVLARPIVRLLFEGGAFTAASTEGTAGALLCLAAGIPFVSVVRNVVPAFYAMKDAKTPVVIATVTVVANVAAALLLMPHWAHRGLAAAIAIASATQAVLLLIVLRRRLPGFPVQPLCISGLRSLVCAALMGTVVWSVAGWWQMSGLSSRGALLIPVLSTIVIGMGAYLAALRLFHAEAFSYVKGMLRRR